jgi:hypothetical protein
LNSAAATWIWRRAKAIDDRGFESDSCHHGSRHMPRHRLARGGIPPGDIPFCRLSYQLINAALSAPGRHRHVMSAQGVAQRPSLHETIPPSVRVGDRVLRLAKFAHVLFLHL